MVENNFDENSADEQSAENLQNSHQDQNGDEKNQHFRPSDPNSRNINGNGNGMATPTSSRMASSSSLASTSGKTTNKGSVQRNVSQMNQKKKSPAVETMCADLREMMKKPPPPLPKITAASSSSAPKMPSASLSSSSFTYQNQQKWNKQIGEEEMLMALKYLLQNLRSKKAKQEAKIDGEYNVICRLRNIKATAGDGRITVKHVDGPFNDVDKPFGDDRLQALKAYAELMNTSTPRETIRPPAPLNMISLLQMCSEDPSLELEPTEAMEIATKLFNKGFITNPRTLANTFMPGFPSENRIKQVIKQMDEICGSEGRIDAQIYLSHWRPWSDAKNSQKRAKQAPTTMNGNGAEPIQPNLMGQMNLEEKRTLEGKEKAMYLLICRHFLATFHVPYKMSNYKFIFEIGSEKFKYECKVLDPSTINLFKILPQLKPKGSLEKLPNSLAEKIRNFNNYIVSDAQKCNVVDSNGRPNHGLTQLEFIGMLAENDCCALQIPEMFKKLKEKKLINMVGQFITLSSDGMQKISDQIALDEDVDDDDVFIEDDDLVENSDDVDSIQDEANSFMREREQMALESDSNDEAELERSRSRQHSGRRNASPMPPPAADWSDRGSTMPTSILRTHPPRRLPDRISRRVQFESPLPRDSRSRDREELVMNGYNHDMPMTFPPRRQYILRSGGGNRIGNVNSGAEQNENEMARNAIAFDPAKYKTTICKFWLAFKSCAHGDQCKFAHGQNDLRHLNDSWEEAENANGGAGQNGNFDPAKYKTTICKFWLGNSCTQGDQCNFAHGQEELRNLNDSWEEPAPSTRPPFRGLPQNRKRPYPELQEEDAVANSSRNWQSRRNDGNVDSGRQLNSDNQQYGEPRAKRPNRFNPMQYPHPQQQQQQGPMTRSRARVSNFNDGPNGNWSGNRGGGQNGIVTTPYGGGQRQNGTPRTTASNSQLNGQLVRTTMGQQQFRRTQPGPNARPGPSNGFFASPPVQQIGAKIVKGALPPQNGTPKQRMRAPVPKRRSNQY